MGENKREKGARNRKERQDFFPEPFMARFSHGIFDSGEKSRRKKRESGKTRPFSDISPDSFGVGGNIRKKNQERKGEKKSGAQGAIFDGRRAFSPIRVFFFLCPCGAEEKTS